MGFFRTKKRQGIWRRIKEEEKEEKEGGEVQGKMASTSMPFMWTPQAASQDQHVAFRATFTTSVANTELRIDHFCTSWYNVFLDGSYIAEGPTRFMQNQPFYDSTILTVPTVGKHVVAIHAHNAGVNTRMLLNTLAVVSCAIQPTDTSGKQPISPISWKCLALSPTVFSQGGARLSPLLGWVERCSVTWGLHQTWKTVAFDDSKWESVSTYKSPALAPPVPLSSVGVKGATSYLGNLTLVDHGTFVERFGYAADDYAARFSLRLLTTSTAKSAQSLLRFAPTRPESRTAKATQCMSRYLALACVTAVLFEVAYHMSGPSVSSGERY